MNVWVVTNNEGIPIMVFPNEEIANDFVHNNMGNLDISFAHIHRAEFSTT